MPASAAGSSRPRLVCLKGWGGETRCGVVPKGMTRQSLRRRSDPWQRALQIKVDPEQDLRRPALLPQYRAGPFLAVELDSGFLLAEDGLEQRHCIGAYTNAWASGPARVFSLRSNGKRTATIELQLGRDGAWRMVQFRGKANSVVRDAHILEAAGRVVRPLRKPRAHARARGAGARPQLSRRLPAAEGHVPLRAHWTV